MAASKITSTVTPERTCDGIFRGFSDEACARFICEYTTEKPDSRIYRARSRIYQPAQIGSVAGLRPVEHRGAMYYGSSMRTSIQITWVAVSACGGMFSVDHAVAQTCLPEPNFVNTPPPQVAPLDQLVSHTEEITVDRPLAVVLADVNRNRPLSESIKKSASLPGVAGSYMLTSGDFRAPGSRRLNCLTDGSTLVEQVLEREQEPDKFRFRYVVWNYTSVKARPIVYGVGEFTYSAQGNRTHIRWTYSFQLNRHRFPGMLGGFGAYLFRVGFLDRQYAAMMRSVLSGTQSEEER
jgi:hypothetical protein